MDSSFSGMTRFRKDSITREGREDKPFLSSVARKEKALRRLVSENFQAAGGISLFSEDFFLRNISFFCTM